MTFSRELRSRGSMLQTGEARARAARELARSVVCGAALAASLPVLVWPLAGLHWSFDLGTHFTAIGAAVLLPCVLALVALRSWRWLAFAGVLLVVSTARVVPLYVARDNPADCAGAARLVLANVNTANREQHLLVGELRAQHPDLVLVLEAGAAWASALDGLAPLYPHRWQRIREDNFGIVVLSKRPLSDVREVTLPGGIPAVTARVGGERPFTLIGGHPLPPVGGEYASLRNQQFTSLAELARDAEPPVVLLADLNSTSWSPHFVELLERGRLHDSRRGFGVQPSWPDSGFGPLRIPIDHALLSEGAFATKRSVSDSIGSDHRAVWLEVCFGR